MGHGILTMIVLGLSGEFDPHVVNTQIDARQTVASWTDDDWSGPRHENEFSLWRWGR